MADKTIMLVCATGMSTSLLVSKMKKAAAAQGLDAEIFAVSALMGEQPNPWDRLQPQDAMSRHRGAKPPRRCELLGEISLLSPG